MCVLAEETCAIGLQVQPQAEEGADSPGAGVRVVSCLMWVLGAELGSSARQSIPFATGHLPSP